jgi:limonene-1,2-epoxide hydrolase
LSQNTAIPGPGHASESENKDVVLKFFADWSKRDVHLLAKYLADDFAYQMIEGEPDIIGPAMFVETLKDVLPAFTHIDMGIRRIECYGHVVMVDRYDRMTGTTDANSMKFEVVGMLVVKDGKITALRDYPIPGGIFELGSDWDYGSTADQQRLETAARKTD